MRGTIARITAPFLSRIPDPSLQPPRRQVSVGLLASVLLHVLLLLLALLISWLLPQRAPLDLAVALTEPDEIELIVMPPDEEDALASIPLTAPATPFMSSLGLATSDQVPDQAVFESDLNMVAASELPATGLLPLPSQDGRTSDLANFTNQRVRLGASAVPFPMDVRLNAPVAAPAEPAPPQKNEKTATEKSPPAATPVPLLAKVETKPTKLKEVDQPGEDEVAVATKPQATPEPAPKRFAMPRLRLPTTDPALPTPAPAPRPAAQAYQQFQEKTRVEGSISNRGRNAVSALGTPLGRYTENVSRLVGSGWNRYCESSRDLIAIGSLRLHFIIDRTGRVVEIQSDDNTSNATFENICKKAVLDAQFPPPSPEVAEALPDGKLDMTIRFTLF